MSSPDPQPDSIEDVAIAWLTEREDGFPPLREREFARWLRADPRHAAAVARLEQTLGRLRELPEFRAELNTDFGRAAPVVPFSPPVVDAASVRATRRGSPVLAWAGLAALLTIVAFTGWRTLRPSPALHYATTTAGYERARLDDGSTLELNAATALSVRFTAAERRVEIETGEAHFAVAHDAGRPFVVTAGDVSVRAVGTAFNVRYSAGGVVEIVVVEGRVRVIHRGRDSLAASEALLVSAGERVVVPVASPVPVVEKLTPAAFRDTLAWQSPLEDFADAPLASVVARFNARSRVQLVLADEALADRRIGGTFALDEAETFVRLLERDGEIVGERRGEAEIHLRLRR
jgi:transmembrane sensor